MHNCKSAQNGLIDLALDETPENSRQLLAELNGCLECRQEYEAVRNTLRLSTQALRSGTPSEGFWRGYNDQLRDALVAHSSAAGANVFETHPRPTSAPIISRRIWFTLRSLLTTSVRVPLPAAAAVLVLFAISVAGLLWQGRPNDIPATQLTAVETKTVTLPVVQEKVITRVVYVPRKTKGPSRRFDRPAPTDLSDSLARVTPTSSQEKLNLTGFAPTDKVRLTVIKGNYRNEK